MLMPKNKDRHIHLSTHLNNLFRSKLRWNTKSTKKENEWITRSREYQSARQRLGPKSQSVWGTISQLWVQRMGTQLNPKVTVRHINLKPLTETDRVGAFNQTSTAHCVDTCYFQETAVTFNGVWILSVKHGFLTFLFCDLWRQHNDSLCSVNIVAFIYSSVWSGETIIYLIR